MATIETLQGMLDEADRMARIQMGTSGKVPAQLLCQKSSGEKFGYGYDPLPPETNRRHEALKLGKQLREWGVTIYVVIYEAWIPKVEPA